MTKNQIDYASAQFTRRVRVLSSDLFCFRDQHGRELLARAGSEFSQFLRANRLAKGVHHEAQ